VNKICLSVILEQNNTMEIIERILKKEPDLVEFRLDSLHDTSILKTIAKNKFCPIIATDRSHRDPLDSEKMLLNAAEMGFDFIDVDLAHPFVDKIVRHSKASGAEIIISHHDFSRTPTKDTLMRILHSQLDAGGDICKIVTNATNTDDNLTILAFVNEASHDARVVSFAMGKLGVPSRALSPIFGAEFTFAAMNEESRTAVGQLSIDDLRRVWRLLDIA